MSRSSARPRYTLLIPTYNRPAHLRSLLGYFAARRFQYPIQVLDSSSAEVQSQNEDLIRRSLLNVVHRTYDTTIPALRKLVLAAETVETPYCSFCPDDDILLTDRLDEILDALDADPGLAAAHGDYINFRPGETFDISDIFYWAPSITAEDPLKRIVEQMSNYQAIFYAIQRAHILRSVFSQLERVQSALARELLSSSLTLIAGGVLRVPHFHMARNTEPSIPTDGWHPYQFLATKPESLFREYHAYRAIVTEHLVSDAHNRTIHTRDHIEKVLDLVHFKYLTPMMSPPIIDYILSESLRPGSEPGKILAGIRETFERPPPPATLKDILRHVRQAMLRPQHAKALASDALHILRLFNALKRAGNGRVRIGHKLDEISVDRITRDGAPRRYVLLDDFLKRRMAAERQVTAAQTVSVLEQFDDYV